MRDPYKYIARRYDWIFEPLNTSLRQIGVKMYPAREGIFVLGIGCGTDAHLKLYQKEICHVFGIDLLPGMPAVAMKKLGDTANLRVCDATKTGFSGYMFDIILSSTVLYEMLAQVRINSLKEATRIQK